jgi:FMN hydrolase / 5-amino-6-(5-phospho-D-ribitylamino)uracil phosphatase
MTTNDPAGVLLADVRVITFDADDTLWDFDTAMRAALTNVIELLAASHPEVAARWTVDALRDRRDAIAEAHRGELTIVEMRDKSFVDALAADGIDDPAVAWALRERYFHHRHGDVQLFDDVHPGFAALDALAAERGVPFAYGLVTNGNTDPERSGLPGRFAFTVYADEVGVAKPDPAIYARAAAAAAELTGCAPHQVLHVGDSYENDVRPAAELGLPTVLIDRRGPGATGTTTRGVDGAPTATITQLTGLAPLLSI